MPDTPYTVNRITGILSAHRSPDSGEDPLIRFLLTDSRSLGEPEGTLFVALSSDRNDGHRYIPDLIKRGVRLFLVSRIPPMDPIPPDAVFIVVPDTLSALQQLATFHRHQFSYPVIGITGSNGKTIVKEWLYQLLSPDMPVTRSPKSYNSQTGVPLSVWNMQPDHRIAILEAGISQTGEMEKLAAIIDPTIGIFTNIGPPHDAGFDQRSQKIAEKLKLFSNAEMLIYRSEYQEITEELNALPPDRKPRNTFTWGIRESDPMRIQSIEKAGEKTMVVLAIDGAEESLTIPFTDDASIENALHCRAALHLLSRIPHPASRIPHPAARITHLTPVAMRLELKEATNHCSLINDSYNSDIHSLEIALDFLMQQQQHPRRTLILSDILQTGRHEEELYSEVTRIIGARQVDRLIGIGPGIRRYAELASLPGEFYDSTDDFLARCPLSSFQHETILLKGARQFEFERISQALQLKAHETVLEINLSALLHNLNVFRSRLKPGVKTMAMVKAFSYGSGSFEIANLLQFHRVDYLAVAYTDEGVELRKAGITMPILVMSPEAESLETLLHWNLEPEIYSLRLLRLLEEAVDRQHLLSGSEKINIHLKLDTGMHRLGFSPTDIDALLEWLSGRDWLKIQSIFTHLAASEDPALDGFTREQINRFREMSERIRQQVPYPVLRHVLNSAGISRFPDDQFDMVRVGIGMYGIGHDATEQQQLQQVATWKSVITQIKQIRQGETVGYNRKGVAERDTVIATIPVGYGDGLNRRFGNGKGVMLVNGLPAPTIGTICMDLCMLDITGIVRSGHAVKEGDRVIIFGDSLPVTGLAKRLGTIPYEIMTAISRRVKRLYIFE